MRKILTLMLILFSSNSLFSQAINEEIEKIYKSNSDTILYKYSILPEMSRLVLKPNGSVSPGINNAKGIVTTVYIGKDSLKIYGDNYPYERRTKVTIETPRGKSVVIFRYNSNPSNLSQAYIEANDRKVNYEIPEVYELANIIWTLSPTGKRATDLSKNTAYFKVVENYFKPYLNHSIFRKLDFSEKEYAAKYYNFRENAFMYAFQDDKIVNGGSYNYVTGDDWTNFTNLFTDLLPLVEDFAKKTNFRKFYTNNKARYSAEIKRMQELLPIQDMWNWLEQGFPAIKYNSYKIIFSPLIGGSHSTQNYSGLNKKTGKWYRETVMFTCGTERYDRQKELTEKLKEGLMSGVVFTEIDHNYVNPTSSKFQEEISTIFNKDGFWAASGEQWYNSPILVFNEYMTHAVFCLWVNDTFDKETAAYVIDKREELNVNARNFSKFKAFNQELLRLHKENPNLSIEKLYPLIIEWSKKQI